MKIWQTSYWSRASNFLLGVKYDVGGMCGSKKKYVSVFGVIIGIGLEWVACFQCETKHSPGWFFSNCSDRLTVQLGLVNVTVSYWSLLRKIYNYLPKSS